MTSLSNNIKFSYLYRDASNYKNFNEIIFYNDTDKDIDEIEIVIKRSLVDEQWFIAYKWKVPDMHFREYDYDGEVDHDWHEFESAAFTKSNATEAITFSEFLSIINIV